MALSTTEGAYPTITPKRILLIGPARHDQTAGAGTITPGYLVELSSTKIIQAHSSAGGNAEAMFAEEDALQGNGIGDNYNPGDLVSYVIAGKGALVYAWLAAGQTVSPATFLQSNGDGTLTPYTSGKVVGKCMDTLSSASDATKTRIRVRIV